MGKYYDCHNHTLHSHDSKCVPQDLCEAAIRKGISGIAVTNHCDMDFYPRRNTIDPVLQGFDEVPTLQEKYRGVLLLQNGVELGGGIRQPEKTAWLLHEREFDLVIQSVHTVRYPGYQQEAFSQIDFSAFSEELILDYLRVYFEDVRETVETMDSDVLPHLTVPLRYICGRYNRTVDINRFEEVMVSILQTAIKKDMALEVNTSNLNKSTYRVTTPPMDWVRRYYEMGGRKITLASDSHVAENVGIGFEETVAELKKIGFCEAVYYQKRKAIPYEL